MTNGGPANSTLTIVMYLYQKGFQRFQMGYASALAWIAFGIIFVITTIQFRVSSRWVVEDYRRTSMIGRGETLVCLEKARVIRYPGGGGHV